VEIFRIAMIVALVLPILSSNSISAQNQHTASKTPSAASATSALGTVWSGQLNKIATGLGELIPSDTLLSRYRDELETIQRGINKQIAGLNPKVVAAKKELDALGPAPAKDALPEVADVAAQRKEFTDRWSLLQGDVKKANVALVRANKLLTDISDIRRSRFVDQITVQGPSPLSPTM